MQDENVELLGLCPAFQVGDLVEVVGKYAEAWRTAKCCVGQVTWNRRLGTVSYGLHDLNAPSSDGMTDGWPEEDLRLVKRAAQSHAMVNIPYEDGTPSREWVEKSPAPVTDEKRRAALSALRHGSFVGKEVSGNQTWLYLACEEWEREKILNTIVDALSVTPPAALDDGGG